jgi:hypothetical protein
MDKNKQNVVDLEAVKQAKKDKQKIIDSNKIVKK